MLTERAGAPTGWLARMTRVSLRGQRVAGPAGPVPTRIAGGRAALDARQKALLGEVQGGINLYTEEQERRFLAARNLRDVKRQRLFRAVMACGVLGPLGALFMHFIDRK